MRQNKFYRILIIITGIILSVQLGYSQTPNEVIGRLVGDDDMFELQKQHTQLKDSVTPFLNYISEAVLANAFNQPSKGINILDSLLQNEEYQQYLGLTGIVNLTLLKAKLYEDEYQYGKASGLLSSFMMKWKDELTEGMKMELKNVFDMDSCLSKAKPFKMIRPNKDCEINCDFVKTKNGKGETLFVPAEINGSKITMIFDTGCAKHSFISEHLANKFGLIKLVDSVPLKGVAGDGTAWIGLADSLKLGEISFYNTMFFVSKEITTDGDYLDNGVLSSALFNALGEINFYPKKNKIVFPIDYTDLPATGQNLTLHNRQSYIKLSQADKDVLMHFDTGNIKTDLSYNFYTKNKTLIAEKAVQDSIKSSGFGGVIKQMGFILPYLEFELAGVPLKLEKLQGPIGNRLNIWREDGSFGVDFIKQFSKVTVSYKKMFISGEM